MNRYTDIQNRYTKISKETRQKNTIKERKNCKYNR